MHFRPCIDIHNGCVKQIVGATLKDTEHTATENFVAREGAEYYAARFQKDDLPGGHVILLNPPGSPDYAATKAMAKRALQAYPGGLQLGGGVTSENAGEYLEAGASHVIVTSYIFAGGQIHWDHLKALTKAVGKEHVVLDVSCLYRPSPAGYYIATDRWQTVTDIALTPALLESLSPYCDEFLVHGIDVEGTRAGVDENLVRLLASFDEKVITYAGGIGSMDDLRAFADWTGGKLDFTIGSALDLYGGSVSYAEVRHFAATYQTA